MQCFVPAMTEVVRKAVTNIHSFWYLVHRRKIGLLMHFCIRLYMYRVDSQYRVISYTRKPVFNQVDKSL